jgi:hypothetical protein
MAGILFDRGTVEILLGSLNQRTQSNGDLVIEEADYLEERKEYLGLLRDYEEAREELYGREIEYVAQEQHGVAFQVEQVYFPEHLYREAIENYQDVLSESYTREVEKSETRVSTR